jgi:hypothetical protein
MRPASERRWLEDAAKRGLIEMSVNPRVSEAQCKVLAAFLLARTHVVAVTGGTIDFFGPLEASQFIEQTLNESRVAGGLFSAFRMQGEHITNQSGCPPEQVHLEALDLSGSVTAAQYATDLVKRILDVGLDPSTQTPPVRQYLIKTAPAHFRFALVFHPALMELEGMQDQVLQYLCSTYGQLCILGLPTFPNLDCRVVVWRTLSSDEPCAEQQWQDYKLQLDMRLCAGEHHNLLKPPHLGLLAKDILEAMGTGDTA